MKLKDYITPSVELLKYTIDVMQISGSDGGDLSDVGTDDKKWENLGI